MTGLVIEAAMNGETRPERNPHVARLPHEIAADGLACLEAGAAMLHSHIDDPFLHGEIAAARYAQGWTPILAAVPDAIVCPTMAAARTMPERTDHFDGCARAGARMAPLDPGCMNMPVSSGLPGEARMITYVNSFEDIAFSLERMSRLGLAASIGIYEPGFLRAVVAFKRAGKLPPGSLVKFYFFGGLNYYDAKPCIGFGLEPSAAALEAYLEIIGDSGVAWAAAVVGGCLFASGMARLAIERGGHVRVGLEDFAGERTPDNATLIREVAGIGRDLGRAPLGGRETAALLGMA